MFAVNNERRRYPRRVAILLLANTSAALDTDPAALAILNNLAAVAN